MGCERDGRVMGRHCLALNHFFLLLAVVAGASAGALPLYRPQPYARDSDHATRSCSPEVTFSAAWSASCSKLSCAGPTCRKVAAPLRAFCGACWRAARLIASLLCHLQWRAPRWSRTFAPAARPASSGIRPKRKTGVLRARSRRWWPPGSAKVRASSALAIRNRGTSGRQNESSKFRNASKPDRAEFSLRDGRSVFVPSFTRPISEQRAMMSFGFRVVDEYLPIAKDIGGYISPKLEVINETEPVLYCFTLTAIPYSTP